MARSRRVAKKIIKDNRESLVTQPTEVLSFAERNFKYIVAGIVGVVLVMLALLIWNFIDNKNERRAGDALHRALVAYQEALKEDKPLDEALKQFQTIAQDYERTSAGALSAFYAGNCLFARQNYDEAIGQYRQFVQSTPEESHLHILAYDSLGYCYEGKGDYQKAVEYFQKTVTPPPGLGEMGYLNLARCYEALGDKEKSLDNYRRIVSEFPEGQRTSFARERIKVLEADNISAAEQLPTEVVTEPSEQPAQP